MRKVLVCVVIFVLRVVVFHAICFNHHHREDFFGSGIQALIHGEQKKWLWFLPVVFLLVLFKNTVLFSAYLNNFLFLRIINGVFQQKQNYFMVSLFARGILNPKFYA